jgi:hypothetical protein
MIKKLYEFHLFKPYFIFWLDFVIGQNSAENSIRLKDLIWREKSQRKIKNKKIISFWFNIYSNNDLITFVLLSLFSNWIVYKSGNWMISQKFLWATECLLSFWKRVSDKLRLLKWKFTQINFLRCRHQVTRITRIITLFKSSINSRMFKKLEKKKIKLLWKSSENKKMNL